MQSLRDILTDMTEEKMIEIKNISYAYENNKNVLSDITISIKEGESVGIVGANGAGKSTLLKILVGLCDGFSGEVIVDGFNLNKKNLNNIRKKAGYVFQDSDSQLFMTNVYDDVAFAPKNYGYSKEETDRLVKNALESVGAQKLIDRKTYKLSGGEKKMVSIATVLSVVPDIILMDEPTIALDPSNRRKLINLLNTFSRTKLIASHYLDMVMDTCERTILINNGKIIADAPTKKVLTDKKLLEDNGLELPLSLYNRG